MKKVSDMSYIDVLTSEYRWPMENIFEDIYDDDISAACISDISLLLSNKKNILIIGCTGGGFNTFELCKDIMCKSLYTPQITVIDRNDQKNIIGIKHLIVN